MSSSGEKPVATVAVIIPAYHGGALLRAAVDSVLGQTWRDFELVVVDAGGGEDLAWAEGLDPRLTVVRQPNAGVSGARNTGASRTSAELIAYLDQDDRWLPDKLAIQLAHLPPQASASVTDYFWIFDGPELAAHEHPITRASLLAGDHFCLSSLMVRRAALTRAGGFDPALSIMQDWDLALKISRSGDIAHVDLPLVEYVVHSENASHDYHRGYKERVSILRREPRNDEERRSSREGMRSTRRLYGRKAFFTFVETRKFVHVLRALRWSPVTVMVGLLVTTRRRLNDLLARSRKSVPD